MKKVLFVADSLSVGGLEKSLIELLKFFDHDRWQVDLYLISDGRALVNQLHQRVNLLPDSPHYHDYYAEGWASRSSWTLIWARIRYLAHWNPSPITA